MRGNNFLLLLALMTSSTFLFGQTNKQYTVDASADFNKLMLSMYSPSGTCRIRPTMHSKLVTIHCKSEDDNLNPIFTTSLEKNTKYVKLDFDKNKSAGFTKTISNRLFSSDNELENKINVYLSNATPLFLNLKYGMGTAYADLSGLPVKKLKISTGSADVTVGYQEGKENLIKMDTFLIKVDMGSIVVKKVNLSMTSNLIADVGFGDLRLEFSDTCAINTNVKASVGAGTLEVVFANQRNPVVVHLNNSLLCRVKLGKHFRKLEKNVFVNNSYNKDAKNLVTFDIDVAMGNIIFR